MTLFFGMVFFLSFPLGKLPTVFHACMLLSVKQDRKFIRVAIKPSNILTQIWFIKTLRVPLAFKTCVKCRETGNNENNYANNRIVKG